ncbi:MAG: hypothetical protein FWD36_08615 [Treponema sp.]|nr:hypothetical protein [Treponema sp.]
MIDNFYAELNKKAVEAMQLGVAFFMQMNDTHIPCINNSFTGNPITGANFLNLLLSNNLNGTNHTEYVKMNDVQSARPNWLSNLPQGNNTKRILYQEETQSGFRFSFVMATTELNQDIFRDSISPIRPRPHYVPFQTSGAALNDFGGFIMEQFTNAINASFTGCAFRSNIQRHEQDIFKTMLIAEIARNPGFIAEMANRAHQEVMDRHYLPFNKIGFIENARDVNSNTFTQLNTVLANHVEDIYSGKKPSFNREFNELAKPIIANIEHIPHNSPELKAVIRRETAELVKEKMAQTNTASTLADTFAGTFVEKGNKLARAGDKILAGLETACVLVEHGMTFTNKIIDKIADRAEGIIDKFADRTERFVDKIADRTEKIMDKSAARADKVALSKIIDFDNAPFSISGSGRAGSQDYAIARRAEKTILEMHPMINKDEYQKDMTNKQIVDFTKTVAEKMGGGIDLSSDDKIRDVVKIAGNIAVSQGLQGDAMLNNCRDNKDTRSFFAGLNQTIREKPQALDQAIAQLQRSNERSQSAAIKR